MKAIKIFKRLGFFPLTAYISKIELAFIPVVTEK